MPISEDKSKKLQEEVFRRYETLPPELKQAMASAATAEAIYAIGKKFGLNVEKTGHLADIIGYTILGIFPIADFVRNLKNSLEVDGTKAEEISREVNNKIFLAIREQLKKTHGEKWDERSMREQPRTAIPREQTQTASRPQAQAAPMAPKSPWEIRPDGFRREIGGPRQEAWKKSVVPPAKQELGIMNKELGETVKETEAEIKKAAPMQSEPPKTREAPQPAPASRAPEILKEIRPVGQPTTDTKQPTIISSIPKPEMAKAAPPANLPFMKEVGKLSPASELEKSAVPKQPEMSKPPQPAPAQKPQAPLYTPALAQKYPADPYREPIE